MKYKKFFVLTLSIFNMFLGIGVLAYDFDEPLNPPGSSRCFSFKDAPVNGFINCGSQYSIPPYCSVKTDQYYTLECLGEWWDPYTRTTASPVGTGFINEEVATSYRARGVRCLSGCQRVPRTICFRTICFPPRYCGSESFSYTESNYSCATLWEGCNNWDPDYSNEVNCATDTNGDFIKDSCVSCPAREGGYTFNAATRECAPNVCQEWICKRTPDDNKPQCWTINKSSSVKDIAGSREEPNPLPSISNFRIVNIPERREKTSNDYYYFTLQNQTKFFDYRLQWTADASSCSAGCPSGGCGSGWSGVLPNAGEERTRPTGIGKITFRLTCTLGSNSVSRDIYLHVNRLRWFEIVPRISMLPGREALASLVSFL